MNLALMEHLAVIAEELNRFQHSAPPLTLPAPDGERLSKDYAILESEGRARIEDAIWRWLKTEEWTGLRASDEFWLRKRLEHAEWLLRCLLTDNDQGVVPCPPIVQKKSFRAWLLIHSWNIGAQRIFSHLDD